MSASRLAWIVPAFLPDFLTVPDSQVPWLKLRIDTGLSGGSPTHLHGTNLLGQMVFPDFPAAVDTHADLPSTGPFAAETLTSFTNDFESWPAIVQMLRRAVHRASAIGVGRSPELVSTTVEHSQFAITWRNSSLESTTRLSPPSRGRIREPAARLRRPRDPERDSFG